MFTEKSDSMIRETLKSLCCSNGWCYGIFWGFDQTNSLLLTLKDAYYEEQMGSLIDNMLLQVHVLGGGVIGQTAYNKNHQWMYSDVHHEMQSYLGSSESLEAFRDDSELYCQFSMGIKTIALISVEPWGVVQLGSTHKNPEMKYFVDKVKQLFRGMDKYQEIKFSENEPPPDRKFFNSDMMQFGYLNSEDLMMEANDSLMLPSQSFPSTSDHQLEQLLLDSPNFFDSSILTQSWPHSIEENACYDFKSERTLDELFRESEPISKIDLSALFSHPISSTSTQFTTVLGNNLPTNSTQSCVTDTFRSNHEVKCSNPIKKQMGWNETLIPVADSDDLSFNTKIRTSNSLFSKLGLDQILDGINATTSSSSTTFAKSRFEDQSSKRRKLDNQVKTQDLPTSCDTRNIEVKSEASTIGDSYSIDGVNTSSSKTRNGKKKAKAGTRPRPKDRQMIQDRLAELRELIPNGEKMSIDRLLERTIRHLDFMQSLTKRADSLKQIEKPKNAGVQKRYSGNGGGVTWACEVGDETMVCPLKVEDLTTPGQMLIEILCEEQGFFLEILDIVRGFGLIVLKGMMEVRETKIWAHFIVEAEGSRRVTRHEIFSSLIQVLQMRGEISGNGNERFGNVISSGSHIPLFNNCQPAVSFPVNFPDTGLQCANL